MCRSLSLFVILSILGCENFSKSETNKTPVIIEKVTPKLFYGIDLNKFSVKTKKIRRGDSFGKILEDNASKFILILEYWQDITAKIAHSQGRTNKILSTTPKLALLDFISWYNFARLEDIHDQESNLVFKKR